MKITSKIVYLYTGFVLKIYQSHYTLSNRFNKVKIIELVYIISKLVLVPIDQSVHILINELHATMIKIKLNKNECKT